MKSCLLIIISSLFVLGGCGISRSVEKSPPPTASTPTVVTTIPAAAFKETPATFGELSFNATISLATGGTENSFTANFRIRKDSLIWVSVRKLGFEGARMMLSKDSVWMVDRLNSRYFAGDYRFFRDKFRIDVNYNLIESLLLANPLSDWSEEPVVVDCSDDKVCTVIYPERYRINQGRDGRSEPEGSTVTVQRLILSKATGRILYHAIEVPIELRKITAAYDRFRSAGQQLFPGVIELSVDDQGAVTRMQMELDSFKTGDAGGFPFKIPGNYTLMK